jgi:hypothetical protein
MKIKEKILSITNNDLDGLDTTYINNYTLTGNRQYFHGKSGDEHYRLLMKISSFFENKILFDVGTNICMSAIALQNNKNTNKIKSFDVEKILIENPKIDNIEFILGDSIEDNDFMNTPFIFLDTYHDGIYEKIVYEHIKNKNWKGILMLDDIHLNEAMINYWNSFTEEKYDLTNIGHWSGTGMVIFE